MGGMTRKGPVDLSGMDRRFFEALSPEARVELLCRLHALAIEQAEKLARDSTNSSRPPSSDGPFGPASGTPTGAVPPAAGISRPHQHRNRHPAPGASPASSAAAKGSGGASLFRPSADENHYPTLCAACATPFEMWDRQSGHSAHFVLDLERTAGGIRIACVRHRYHALECACGVRTAARPGVGVLSTVPGRSRDLLLSEACLVGPALATFIAALSVRYHVSRAKIREFLAVWFGVPLSVGTLDRCIREVGVACEPVVEDLLGDLRQAGVIHADETPWKQHGRLRWLWVVLSSSTAIFHIGSRQGDEIRDLIGDAFLGWLVSDGYGAYRKFKKRQRCLAHKHRNLLAHAPKKLHDEITADYTDMIYAKTVKDVEARRKAFVRKWRLKCPAVATSLEEAGANLFTFVLYPPDQWKSIRTTNAIERLHEEFKRRIKTQCLLPCAETACMLFWAPLASGQITLRRVDGWDTLHVAPADEPLDLAA